MKDDVIVLSDDDSVHGGGISVFQNTFSGMTYLLFLLAFMLKPSVFHY